MQSLGVFCGSNTGVNGLYASAAAELGRRLAGQGIRLVYGGGSVGLMGVIANAVLEAGGEVTGVIPEGLATKELLHDGVADMRVVDSMHARKGLMAAIADGFVALPGGYGTFEELFEIITWAQLGLHQKPIGLLNTAGYFDALARLIDHAVNEGFIKEKHRGLVSIAPDAALLLEQLRAYQPTVVSKWITPPET